MLSFRQWLESAGMVDSAQMNNVAADDEFKRIRSKWMAGNIPQRGSEFDSEGMYGKKKHFMKSEKSKVGKKRHPKSK